MAKYGTNQINATTPALQAIAATYKTQISIFNSGTPRRIKLYDLNVGTAGTPADNYMEFDVARSTVDGTATADTPNPLDPADAACLTSSKINYTAEPTITANSSLWYLGINQRASYRWVAAPGSELVAPATAANGLNLRARSAAYTGFAACELMFEEQ